MKTAVLTIHCSEEDWSNLGATCKPRVDNGTISIEVEEGQEYRVGLLSLEIKSITSDTIVFSIWPKDPVTLKKGEPYLFTKTLSGYTDHEGCDWDGTDYDYTIRWVR